MASTQELIFKISADGKAARSELAQIRAEITKTAQTQKSTGQGDLTMRQQLAAVASLQRQRSAALVSQWKQEQNVVTGLRAHIARLTDTMQALGSSSAVLQGPLGGVAGRLRSVGALATEAGGGLGIAGAAAGALVVAAAAAALGIYKLTVAAAAFQGKMFDLAQQTGVSVETLSTLEVVAQTTGGNIDAIAQSLGVFQSHLEAALDPTSKEAALLQRLGVEATDTEGALRQTLLALSKMTVGFEQTTAARDLFGGRGAKAFLAILKETNGDIDGTTERLRKMGILITTEAATAADKFNDQLAEVGFQIRGLTAIVGNEAMPTITRAVGEVSKLLTDNRGDFVGWAGDVADAARGAIVFANAIYEINNAVSGMALLPPGYIEMLAKFSQEFSGLPGVFRELQKLGTKGEIPAISIPDLAVPLRPSDSQGTTIKARKARAGKTTRDTSLQDARSAAALAEREAIQKAEVDIAENKRALDQQVRDIEDFTKRAIALEDQLHDAAIVRINAEQEALDAALAKKLIKRKDYDIQDRELALRNEEAKQKNSEEVFQLEQERDKRVAAAQIAAKNRELQIAEDADQRAIDRIKDRIDRGILLESEGEQQIGVIIDEGFARRKKALEEEETAYGLTLERRKDITAELIRLDGDRAGSAEETARRIVKAQFEEQNKGFAGATRPRRTIDPLLEKGPFVEFSEQLTKAGILSKETSQLIGGTLAGAFGELASAVGQAVHSFVLFGKVEGGFRRFAAEMIAGLAASAAVQAVYQLAQGLAWLALSIFFPNPQYVLAANMAFASAAVFGTIAGAATIAGRALSGNNFNNSGGGGGSGRDSGGSASPSSPKPIEMDRRGSSVQQQPQRVEIVLKLANGAHQFIEGSVIENWNSNGRIRTVIQSDGA